MTFWDFIDKCVNRIIFFVKWLIPFGIWAFTGYLLGAWLGGGTITDRFADTDLGNVWVWAWLIFWPVMFVVSVAWWKAMIAAALLVILIGTRIDRHRGLSFYGWY